MHTTRLTKRVLLLAVLVIALFLLGCASESTESHQVARSAHVETKEPPQAISRPGTPLGEPETVCLGDTLVGAERSLQSAIDTWNGYPATVADLPIPGNSMDLATALAHELGHGLGIREHIQGQENVMFSIISGYGASKRSVTAVDMALLPPDAPELVQVADSEHCDIRIELGGTRYAVSTGETIEAACLSYAGLIVCNEKLPWYFIP